MSPPLLKVVGLHVERLKALRDVEWPRDGMGWNGEVPDVVLIGGANGSGKTTLLELIVECVRRTVQLHGTDPSGGLTDLWVDTLIEADSRQGTFRCIAGDTNFIGLLGSGAAISYAHSTAIIRHTLTPARAPEEPFHQALIERGVPPVIYLPADRALITPHESRKAAGKLLASQEFFYRFEPPKTWAESIEALLYSARWEDLNAKEEGREEHNFEAYSKAFSAFFEGKELAWERGELIVRVADGGRHSIDELSSGEKQIVVLLAELHRRWKPGSLIVIDEPEAHMHPVWLARLWKLLVKWREEKGGQLIVATQSTQLFGLADPGTKIILGGGEFR